MDLRLINNHTHPHLTMPPGRLSAIHPNRLRVIHRHHELHRPRTSSERLKAGVETTCERAAGVGEAGLGDGVVSGEVAEGEGVAGCGYDVGGVEEEFGIGADGDGDVFGEGKGEEEREGEGGDGGMHDWGRVYGVGYVGERLKFFLYFET